MIVVIPPRRHLYLYSDRVITTIPPNPLSMKIGAPMSLGLDGTEAHGAKHGHNVQHQQTERPKDQCLLHLCTIEKLFPPDKEEDGHARGHFLFFSFILSYFHLFTMNVTRALSLEAIKGEVGATSRPIESITHRHTIDGETTHTPR
jgi:hypothetical protein